MNISGQLKHDFTNNAIRIEVLNKLVLNQLEDKKEIDPDFLTDLEKFLKLQLEYLAQF